MICSLSSANRMNGISPDAERTDNPNNLFTSISGNGNNY